MGAEEGLRLLQVADRIRAPAARVLGTRCTALRPARTIRPRHPPSTWARSRRRDERQGQHSTRRAQMLLARHHLRASVCAHLLRSGAGRLFASAPPAPSATSPSELLDNGVLRLRLRLRHRNCSTTGSFEARLHETRSHHFRYARCASRSRERTTASFFTSRLRQFPIHS